MVFNTTKELSAAFPAPYFSQVILLQNFMSHVFSQQLIKVFNAVNIKIPISAQRFVIYKVVLKRLNIRHAQLRKYVKGPCLEIRWVLMSHSFLRTSKLKKRLCITGDTLFTYYGKILFEAILTIFFRIDKILIILSVL